MGTVGVENPSTHQTFSDSLFNDIIEDSLENIGAVKTARVNGGTAVAVAVTKLSPLFSFQAAFSNAVCGLSGFNITEEGGFTISFLATQ
jgi:hypothetical protein